ncbi:SRCRM protein, partial [Cinclus mexicanus]|nr:SRCRM protein [Cinclus mexicanus]
KPPCAAGNAAAVNCSGIVESLRLVEHESWCSGWLELAISTGAWRRVPGEVSLIRNFSEVCRELGCGELDKSDVVAGPVYLQYINTNERAIMDSVVKTIMKMTTVMTRPSEELPSYLFTDSVEIDVLRYWLTTAPAGIPHGVEIF